MSRKGMVIVAALFVVAFALLALASRGYRELEAIQSLDKAEAAVKTHRGLWGKLLRVPSGQAEGNNL